MPPSRPADPETAQLADRLSQAAHARITPLVTPRWWQQSLLDWATENEDFRVQLLRFVDVLPALRTNQAVADHVLQYFRDGAPPFVAKASRLAAQPVLQPLLTGLVEQAVHAMAGRFIAGATPQQALPQLERMVQAGQAFTVDLLGEATLADAEADQYLASYQSLIAFLAARPQLTAGRDGRWAGVPPVNVSIKLSALSAHFEPAAPTWVSDAIRPRLLALLRTARAHGAYVHVDMEQHRFKDLVHRVFADVALDPEFRDWTDLGIVVQAYLRDATDDLDWVRGLAERRGSRLTVRLVKGAYWDEETVVAAQNSWPVPVWDRKPQTDANYERCTTQLLAAWPHLRPAFGTHNPQSLAHAMVAARRAGLQDTDVEFQMLYGLAPELADEVTRLGYRLRVYTPVGAVIPGMAYLVRRLLENTSNEAWFRTPAHTDAAVETEDSGTPEDQPATERAADAQPAAVTEAVFHNAPPARFQDADVRSSMHAALDRWLGRMGADYPLLLAGGEESGRKLDAIRYPADPSLVLGQVAQATAADVERAVAAGLRAYPAWRSRPVAERAGILRRAADLVEARRYDLTAVMVYESGKPWKEADGDITETIDYLRYYAGQAEDLQHPHPLLEPPGEENQYLREPRGVAAVIAPWNFPLAILTGMTVAALATGNTAIVKPAGQSPIVAYHLVRLLHEAGVPPEAVQYLPGPGPEVGGALVAHPQVSTIAFTGSNAVGLNLIATAARLGAGQRFIKQVVAELGGKNAVIIDDDADLDLAVADTVASAFGYAGQKCSACSRLVVVGPAYDDTLRRLGDAVRSLMVGAPHRPETFVPPVISAAARDKICGYIEQGRRTATLAVQRPAPEGPGHYVPPTVFTGVDLDSPLAQEEIFGPVLTVFRAADFGEALAIANHSQFGLTGGLFSRNPAHIAHARRDFDVGNLYINRKVTGAVVGRQAFGGLNMSGEGEKAGGPDYLRQFTVSRTVTENTLRRGFAPK